MSVNISINKDETRHQNKKLCIYFYLQAHHIYLKLFRQRSIAEYHLTHPSQDYKGRNNQSSFCEEKHIIEKSEQV
jgi:hypothetical protein